MINRKKVRLEVLHKIQTEKVVKICNSKQEMQQIVYDSVLDYDSIVINSNEPVYCYCSRVSFGKMINCDNHMV